MKRRDTIRIFVKRNLEPFDKAKAYGDALQKVQRLQGKIPDIFIGMLAGVAQSENHPKPGELATYFDDDDLHILNSGKRIAQKYNCDYELIDVRTGSLLEVHIRNNIVKVITVIGKYSPTQDEQELPTPCCQVRDKILELTRKETYGGDFPMVEHHRNIENFYLDTTDTDAL